MLDRLVCALPRGEEIVKFDVFGPLREFEAFMKRLEGAYGRIDWPVGWVEGNGHPEGGAAGILAHAVSGAAVGTISIGAAPLARVFEDEFAKYCFIGNITPDTASAPRSEQAGQTLEKMEKALNLAGMKAPDIARTWFYNDDIVSWYPEFNAARAAFFRQSSVLDGPLPASTGVGGKNPAHSALIAGALAVRAKRNSTVVREVASPLQASASGYGSLFSRAMEISAPGQRRLLISGTASIDAGGKTVHIGDISAQIPFTMKVVGAVLASRKMDFSDITRSIVYLRRAEDIAVFNDYRRDRGYAFPAITVCADICRDDLLFEIEADAVSAISAG